MTKGSQYKNFHWQTGYAAFSPSPSQVEVVETYIINQEAHHRHMTFQEEMHLLFDLDERYVWD